MKRLTSILLLMATVAAAGGGSTTRAPIESQKSPEARIRHKLQTTIIEHVDFRNAMIDDLMALIRKEAGINVLLSSPRENYNDIRVTLELRKTPLSEVIRYFLMPFPGARARADGKVLVIRPTGIY